MNKYIVLLRGINVSGKNKLPMADLRELFSELGYQNVQTYIQSGNIIIDSKENKEEVIKKIHKKINDQYGYDVPVIIRTISELKKTIERLPYSLEQGKSIYFTFLDRVPAEKDIVIHAYDSDEYKLMGDVVYLSCLGGYGNSKLTNNVFEKKLKVTATTRNYRTTMKLLELATKK